MDRRRGPQGRQQGGCLGVREVPRRAQEPGCLAHGHRLLPDLQGRPQRTRRRRRTARTTRCSTSPSSSSRAPRSPRPRAGCLLGVMPQARKASEDGLEAALNGTDPQQAMSKAAKGLEAQIKGYNDSVQVARHRPVSPAAAGAGPKGHCARRSHVQGVHSPGHRDPSRRGRRPRSCACDRPSPSVPSTSASRSGGSAASIVQADGVLGQREGRHAEAAPAALDAPGPRVDAGPGHLEHRAHRDPDAARYSGSAHRGVTRTASTPSAAQLRNIGPDVGVVDDVLEHHDPSWRRPAGPPPWAAPVAASTPGRRGAGGSR